MTSRTLNVLIVEDSEDDAELLAYELQRTGFQLHWKRVETASEMEQMLTSHAWELVISDVNLPHFSAPAALEVLKKHGPDIPFIVVSGFIRMEEAVELMRAGAHDFVEKEALARLVPAVERELRDAETRRKRQKAEEQAERLAAAVEQAADMVLITNEEGVIQYVNPSFERISGYTLDMACGNKTNILNSGHHDQLFFQQLWSTLTQGETWKGHFLNKKRDGSLLEMDATISPIRDQQEKITSFVAVYRDVTRELQLERQLRQSQKLEAIGTLSGGIAHDFNNILGAILGHAELGLDALKEESLASRSLQEIFRAGIRARDLVAQLLTFSRLSEQKRNPIELAPIVKEVAKFLRATIPATVEIITDVPHETGLVMADPSQIHQVLLNLFTNASQAMPQGGTLHVSLAPRKISPEIAKQINIAQGSGVELTVRDTGIGIDKDVCDRIFDPFFTTKKIGEGTGLGLSVVHGIITSHGGLIEVESTPGEGSLFRVILPCVTQPTEEDQESITLELKSSEGGGSILFVDDEAPLVRVSAQMLQRIGYTVIEATSGEEAWEVFKHRHQWFDVVITDYTMPGINGQDLMEKIHALNAEMPVIITTGFTDALTEEEAAEVGFSGFLQKPVLMSELAHAVQEVLSK
ncbi:response regulator [Magnetococcales bacterium HHB-1]